MILKNGVCPKMIRPELLLALNIANKVWEKNSQDLVVTSLNDGEHSRGSLHYCGQAADLRTRYFTEEVKIMVADDLINALGRHTGYDVVIEKDHIHIEWHPKNN